MEVGIDTEKPIISNRPVNISVPVTDELCTAVVNWTEPTASDNCTLTSFVSNLSPGATIAVGTSTVTYTATDNSGNVETFSFTITVTDNTAPDITCPAGSTVFCVANAPSYSTYAEFTAALGSASDNCSLNTDSFTQLPDSLSGDGSKLTRTYQIADAAGNTNTCFQEFDIFQPAVTIGSLGLNNTCIGEILDITSNSTGLNYQWQVSFDDGDSWSVIGTNSPTYSGSLTNQGDQYRLLVSETLDFTGAGCVSTSNVLIFKENIPPFFTGLKPIDKPVCIPNGATSGAVYDISLDNSKVTDICTAFANLSIAYSITGATTLSGNTNLPDGTVFNLGISTVEYTVTDLSGNSETHSFNVTVSEEPTLTDISTDGIPTTDGSGHKPYQSSTHTYTVDGGTADPDYTYIWTVLDNASVLSPGSANTYTINTTNPAAVEISWGASIPLTANDYKVRIRKTSNTNTCFIEKELAVTVLENLFNAEVVEQGDQCQTGEAGTETIVEWITNKIGGAANWRFDYEISDGVSVVASGLEVPVSGNTKSIFFNVSNQAGSDKTYTFTITNVFDEYDTPETNLGDNEDTVTLWGVPNTSAISTD